MENRNLRISRRRKVGFRDFSQNLRRLSGQTSHTGKADCCGRDHHDHPGSGYQCNGFRNSGIH